MEVAVVVLVGGGGAYINREKIMTIFSFFFNAKVCGGAYNPGKNDFCLFYYNIKKTKFNLFLLSVIYLKNIYL